VKRLGLNSRPFIKILGYLFVFLGVIILLAGLLTAVSVFIFLKGGVFYKKLLLAFLIILAAVFAFFVFFGIYRLIRNYLYISKKVIMKDEEIEEKIEEIEEKIE